MEIMPDHVHLLMEVDPQFGVHKAVKQIKGRTSGAAAGIWLAPLTASNTMDKLVLCIYCGWCAIVGD